MLDIHVIMTVMNSKEYLKIKLQLEYSLTYGNVNFVHNNPISNVDVNKWKNFPRYWPFVRGIHLSP